MPKMPDHELRALLAAEHSSALGGMESSKLVNERATAMDYYLGDMSKDLPAQDGRSRAVSFDVADTIEGLMPSLMEIFVGSDEVVKFDPVGPEDEKAAQQETDYVNHVFMNQNPGFLVLYSFIKDALLSKVGVVKVWWEEREEEERETYTGQTDDAFALITSDPSIEILEHEEAGGLHNVTVARKKDYSCAKVLGVPPEEFGIERGARSLRDANYCFHRVIRTVSQLIDQGFDEEQVYRLPSYGDASNDVEALARDTVDESSYAVDKINKAARLVEIIEHYCRMDYEGTGAARLYRITAGTGGEILIKDGKLDVVPFDAMPFAAMTPVIMTHRFWGRSIADLVLDIQRIKTAVTRGMLDNIYLALNPRVEVAETYASENTLDDLLVSRPGGIVRTKAPGGMQWQTVPNITPAVAPALEYYDAVREWRTGVSRVGQGIDANALQNQSATAVNQAYSASQARMKLIARIFAETGIRDMFWLLHGVIRKHGQQAQTVRLRNEWTPVDPRNWKTRNDLSVNVGLGTGSKAQQLAEIQLIIAAQEKALAAGLTNLVSTENLYNSAKQLTKVVGHKDVDAFFTDPSKQPPPQPHQDPKMIEAQGKLQIEQAKMQAGMQMDQAKLQSTAEMETAKLQLDASMKREQMQAEFALRREQMTAEFALRREEMMVEAEIKREANRMNASVAAEKAKGDGISDTRMGGEVG